MPPSLGFTVWALSMALPLPLEKPTIHWSGGIQHHANNPEIIDQLGTFYSSRALMKGGVRFDRDTPQTVFASSKNMTRAPFAVSLILTNAGPVRLDLDVDMSVRSPERKQIPTRPISLLPDENAVIEVGVVSDGGFVSWVALVKPLRAAAARAAIHVDLVAHKPSELSAKALLESDLLPTEGERGYRVPVSRLLEQPAFLDETRLVMRALGIRPSPLDASQWPAEKVVAWAAHQASLGTQRRPTAFDPAVNRGLVGRVNGLVSASQGVLRAKPLEVTRRSAGKSVRIRTSLNPPVLLATRPGAALRDAGAYGKHLALTVAVQKTEATPRRIRVQLATPPEGQDGAQRAGHESYHGPVTLEATQALVSQTLDWVRIGQPGLGATLRARTDLGFVTVEGPSAEIHVSLETHANAQFPLDVVFEVTEP